MRCAAASNTPTRCTHRPTSAVDTGVGDRTSTQGPPSESVSFMAKHHRVAPSFTLKPRKNALSHWPLCPTAVRLPVGRSGALVSPLPPSRRSPVPACPLPPGGMEVLPCKVRSCPSPEESVAGPEPTSSRCHSPTLPTSSGSARAATSLSSSTRFHTWMSDSEPFAAEPIRPMWSVPVAFHAVIPPRLPSRRPLTYSRASLAAASYTPVTCVHTPSAGRLVDTAPDQVVGRWSAAEKASFHASCSALYSRSNALRVVPSW